MMDRTGVDRLHTSSGAAATAPTVPAATDGSAVSDGTWVDNTSQPPHQGQQDERPRTPVDLSSESHIGGAMPSDSESISTTYDDMGTPRSVGEFTFSSSTRYPLSSRATSLAESNLEALPPAQAAPPYHAQPPQHHYHNQHHHHHHQARDSIYHSSLLMTDEEATRADIEAAEQAEGSIIADSDEISLYSVDGGYESGSSTNASTSLASSVRDYAFENGRRYHKFREGRYNFPNDDVEQEREDMKHAMVKMLCQQLHFAPIGDNPNEILDIGTGTGIWAIEMGEQFPSANVLGIDLSPIQPEWVPPNVRFMVDDVESPWLHSRNHFDYIHSRHTVMAIKDWPRLFMRALEHIRPGGWIELQEIYHYPISMNNTMKADHPIAQYWAAINEGLTNLGVEFHAASDDRLARRMREAGYVNVQERIFHVPIGTWPKNKVLKAVGLYWRTILLDGIQAIALGPMTRGLRWSRERVELFLIEVRKAYYDISTLMYMPLRVVYAQKPEIAAYGPQRLP